MTDIGADITGPHLPQHPWSKYVISFMFKLGSPSFRSRRSSNSLEVFNILQLIFTAITVLSIFPSLVVSSDSAKGNNTNRGGDTMYDYGDDTDPYMFYRTWQEQSLLGKGEKIGGDQPELEDRVPLSPDHRLDSTYKPEHRDTHNQDTLKLMDTHNIDILNVDESSRQQGGTRQLGDISPSEVALMETSSITSISHVTKHLGDASDDFRNTLTQLPNIQVNISQSTQVSGDLSGGKEIPSHANSDHMSTVITPQVYSTFSPDLGGTVAASFKLQEQCTSTSCANTSTSGDMEFRSPGQYPEIYIAGLFPWSEDIPAGSVGRGVLPAVRLALDHVNSDTRVNRKYLLKMAYSDTRCDMAVATKAFFDMMAESQTTTAMLFGDVCYNVTGPMVQIAHQWNMYQLSYGDTNPTLSDRDQFPNFYRTVPSDSDFNPARLALLQYFNWTTVGTIFQDAKLGEARHGYASNRFDSLVEKHKINITVVESFADDPDAAIKKLKLQDVRIIVGNFDQTMARKVFCSARQNSLYGPKHQWIILGTYDSDWWTADDDTITCSPAELNDTIHGYLATDVLSLSTSDEVTESGRTSTDYLNLYNEARGVEFSKYHGYAYDGVWVVAKALDRLLDEASVTSDLFRGPGIGKVLNETNFLGVTGRVQFQNGDRVGSMTILQMQHGKMVKVGEYHALTHSLDLAGENMIIWRDGKPPVDRSIKIEEFRHVSFPVYIGFVVMAALGITMAVLFLALNIRYRHHRYIKMSSPNMNNLIIVGCILCYLSIFLLGADSNHNDRLLFSYWCTARSWTLALGFTLAFGAMFGKTWRVHAIFTNIKLNKKVIKDYKLMLIVLVLVLLDVAILVTWQIVDPFDKAVKRLSPEVYVDFEIIPKLDYCSSSRMEIWLGTLYAYKGLLLVFGCFLAWETRQVSIPALNDSKYIGMSVYNVVIMCVSGAAVSFIIEDKPTQSFVIIGLFIIFCTTITLCLVFLPKIIQLKRNPKGDEQRVRATLRKSTKKSKRSESSVHREKVRATIEENRRLRGFLEQKANELDNLLDQLGDDVMKEDLGLRSALFHKKILELRHVDGSPGRRSIQSCTTSDVECISSYSEGSVTTSIYLNEELPPTTSLLKNRFTNSKLYSEAIEMAGVRFKGRKHSLTIPPAAEDEAEDDPFGGVYLGPSESPTNTEAPDRNQRLQESVEERTPLMANSTNTRAYQHRPEIPASRDPFFDSSPGAQGTTHRRQLPRNLRFRRHSAPLVIWTIAESCLEDTMDTTHAKDTQPLVENSPCTCAMTVYPENAAMTSPMTPSPMTPSPQGQSENKLLWTRRRAKTLNHTAADTKGSPIHMPAGSGSQKHFNCDLDNV